MLWAGMIAIPGTTKVHRLKENWESRQVVLSEEEKKQMREVIDTAEVVGERYWPEMQATVGH